VTDWWGREKLVSYYLSPPN